MLINEYNQVFIYCTRLLTFGVNILILKKKRLMVVLVGSQLGHMLVGNFFFKMVPLLHIKLESTHCRVFSNGNVE